MAFYPGSIIKCTHSTTYPSPHEPGYFMVIRHVHPDQAIHLWGGPWPTSATRYYVGETCRATIKKVRRRDVPDEVWAELARRKLLGEL